jgi:hypothetical protein
METPIWSLFYKLIMWFFSLIPAIFGAAFLIFNDWNDHSKSNIWVPIITFIFGVIIGHNGGGAVVELLGITHDSFVAFSMKFTMGWMGIGILIQARKNIPEWMDAFKRKWVG